MIRSIGRRALLAAVAACHVLATLAVAPPVLAQEPDRAPPTIAFEPLGEGRRGDTQVFSASVVDEDGAVERVTFHFRAAGTEDYTARPMESIAGTSIYSISIDDVDPDATAIEFYIDALDAAGNRSIEGFAFDPLERRLVGPEEPAAVAEATEPAPIEADGLSTGRKVLYGVLGVVVLGAIAAAAGGGDDGDDGGGDDGAGEVPVTIVAEPLQ